MPLDADEKALPRQTDALNVPVFVAGKDAEGGSGTVDELVMPAVDAIRELGHADGVEPSPLGVIAAVKGRVLNKRTAQRSIHHLDAAADAEQRPIVLKAKADERDLKRITTIGYCPAER